jgi:hypothetical protein
MRRTFFNISLVSIGFILSPLTWWNDLIVNVPLAYLISAPVSMIDEKLFLPGFIIAYWLTNLLGLLMLHWGSLGLVKKQLAAPGIKHSLIISVIYSGIIILMVKLGWLASPSIYAEHFR